jgi:hypothetical protein
VKDNKKEVVLMGGQKNCLTFVILGGFIRLLGCFKDKHGLIKMD